MLCCGVFLPSHPCRAIAVSHPGVAIHRLAGPLISSTGLDAAAKGSLMAVVHRGERVANTLLSTLGFFHSCWEIKS